MAKEQNPGLRSIHEKLEAVYAKYDIDGICREHKLETFLKHDLREEAKFIDKMVKEIDSSTVFCHNDFRGSNILVTQPDDKILLCDMEYSRYGPRAGDLAALMYEWGHEFMDFNPRGIPSDEDIKQFIQLYVHEMNERQPGYIDKPKNSVDNITREVKAYFLFNSFFFMAFWAEKDTTVIASMSNKKEDDLVSFGKYFFAETFTNFQMF